MPVGRRLVGRRGAQQRRLGVRRGDDCMQKAFAERVSLIIAFAEMPGLPGLDLCREIHEAYPDIPVQIGGGIRDEDTIQAYLNAGVEYVIIGTKAVNAPHFVRDMALEYPRRIIVGLDAKDGKVAIFR